MTERIYKEAIENAHAYALQAENAAHEPLPVREQFQSMAKMWSLLAMAASMDPNYPIDAEVPSRRIEDVYSDLL